MPDHRPARTLPLVTAGALCLALTAPAALAAPPPRVTVCHVTPSGQVVTLTLPEPAAAAHLRSHARDTAVDDGDCSTDDGDDDVAVLARATTLDADGRRVLVAQLEDVDASGDASPGDVVRTGVAPTTPGVGATTPFTVTEHVVDAVAVTDPTAVLVLAGSASFRFIATASGEQFLEAGPDGATGFVDGAVPGSTDAVLLDPGSPSAPVGGTTTSTTPSSGDDPWFDVELVG